MTTSKDIELPAPLEDLLGLEEGPNAPPKHPPQPIDIAVERKEFGDLLAFIAANKDPDTVAEHVTVDEFLDGLDDPLT